MKYSTGLTPLSPLRNARLKYRINTKSTQKDKEEWKAINTHGQVYPRLH